MGMWRVFLVFMMGSIWLVRGRLDRASTGLRGGDEIVVEYGRVAVQILWLEGLRRVIQRVIC